MKLALRWSVAAYVVVFNRGVLWFCCQSLSAEATPSVNAITSGISKETTCDEWASWAPPRSDPAVVMQLVSEDYVALERNFIRLMELNSALTRQHLFLMCLDDSSVSSFADLGIRCVPVGMLHLRSFRDMWKIRVKVLSCLLKKGYNVIMSDSDALWLGDPIEYMRAPAVSSSSVVASRGSYPFDLGSEWGSTICMGFIMFRATGDAMNTFQETLAGTVSKTGDDQVAVNRAALDLGIAWDEGSDMSYVPSTDVGKGTIANLSTDDGKPFEIVLLPHNKFTRICRSTPVSNDTLVAHCAMNKKTGAKTAWMRHLNLWNPDGISP